VVLSLLVLLMYGWGDKRRASCVARPAVYYTPYMPGDTDVVGEPHELSAAHQLAADDRYQFQWWALSLIQARPLGGDAGSRKGKKGADQGIDGVVSFVDDVTNKAKRIRCRLRAAR
jgi:hypothetical protein